MRWGCDEDDEDEDEDEDDDEDEDEDDDEDDDDEEEEEDDEDEDDEDDDDDDDEEEEEEDEDEDDEDDDDEGDDDDDEGDDDDDDGDDDDDDESSWWFIMMIHYDDLSWWFVSIYVILPTINQHVLSFNPGSTLVDILWEIQWESCPPVRNLERDNKSWWPPVVHVFLTLLALSINYLIPFTHIKCIYMHISYMYIYI